MNICGITVLVFTTQNKYVIYLIKVGVVKIIVNNFECPKIITKLKGYRTLHAV